MNENDNATPDDHHDRGDVRPDDGMRTERLNDPTQDLSDQEGKRFITFGDSTDDQDDPLIGTKVSNFQVYSLLGEGGFARVYGAEDADLGRKVALKFLTHTLNTRYLELFRREAKALGTLSKHENILDIYAWGEHQGNFFIALEYAPLSVANLIEQYPDGLPLERALAITEQCADALFYAHEHGIIHRDIKPHNILLDGPDGKAMVADFGLTRVMESADATRTRAFMGSPPYMSPEQAREEGADHRSDIFSLGATLYEMLCGERAFRGTTTSDLIQKVQRASYVSIRKRARHLPIAITQIVDKALECDPEKRYATAKEFADALRAFQHDQADKTAEQPSVFQRASIVARDAILYRRSFMLSTATALTLALVLGLTMFIPDRTSSAAELEQANNAIEEEDFARAERLLRQIIKNDGPSDEVLYGLGYALLLQGNRKDAESEFSRIQDDSLKTEGVMAVARNAGDPLTGYGDEGITRYAVFMLAMAKYADGNTEEALGSLRELRKYNDFGYKWQRFEMLQALGRALYEAGQTAAADAVFQELSESRWERKRQFASSFLEITQSRLAIERNDQLQDQMDRIHEKIRNADFVQNPVDDWTSRPMTFYFAPTKPNNSVLAGSGVEIFLPRKLAKKLHGDSTFTNIDRDHLGLVLQEKLMSASGISTDNKEDIGKVLGARFIMQCQIARFRGEEELWLDITDSWTTKELDIEDISLEPNWDLDSTVDVLKASIVQAVSNQYPFQGVVKRDSEEDGGAIRINLGQNVGVAVGDEFWISKSRINDIRRAVQNVLARVTSVDSPHYSTVEILPTVTGAADSVIEVVTDLDSMTEYYAFIKRS